MPKTYDFYIGVPYGSCPYDSCLACTREDEAVAIAAGAVLCGKKPMVFMQNSGFANALDVITSFVIPYGLKIDMDVDNRISPEHHKVMGKIYPLIKEVLFNDTQGSY